MLKQLLMKQFQMLTPSTAIHLPTPIVKTYLVRIINAALNTELFFNIAGRGGRRLCQALPYLHSACYGPDHKRPSHHRPTHQQLPNHGFPLQRFAGGDRQYHRHRYAGTPVSAATVLSESPLQNATPIATSFTQSLRGLNSADYPSKVPLRIDHSLLFTIGLGVDECESCANSLRLRRVGNINNVTFVMPKIALLKAHFFKIGGVFSDDFPGKLAMPYDYTGYGKQPQNLPTMKGTRVYRVAYNSTVQVVLLAVA